MKDDLPTLDLPAIAISLVPVSYNDFESATDVTNFAFLMIIKFTFCEKQHVRVLFLSLLCCFDLSFALAYNLRFCL